MKRADAWAGLLLFGYWLTSPAIANPPGRGFHGDASPAGRPHHATAFRPNVLIRDGADVGAGRRHERSRLGPDASRYEFRDHRDRFNRRRDGYPIQPGYYGYADPYAYGYPESYPYPGNYEVYPDAPQYDYQGADVPPVTTSIELITAVQTRLARQAYYDGPLDGVLSEETRRAIREYEADHGLSATGRINPELLSSMAIHYISPLAS